MTQRSSKSVKRLQKYINFSIFSRWWPSVLWNAHLDHPLRELCGLYHCAKFGWNRPSSFGDMQGILFYLLAWKCLFSPTSSVAVMARMEEVRCGRFSATCYTIDVAAADDCAWTERHRFQRRRLLLINRAAALLSANCTILFGTEVKELQGITRRTKDKTSVSEHYPVGPSPRATESSDSDRCHL